MTAYIFRLLATVVLTGSMLHFPAWADPVPGGEAAGIPTSVKSGYFEGPALSSVALDNSRGGTGVQVLNKNALDGVVSDNQAYNLTTGSNWITSGSFSNASGLSTVIQNSGNNVLIQNATIVNLQVQ